MFSILPPSSKGLIIFCNPNAGFYESFSQMDIDNSWLGYYTALGYDFFAFNYRGYGRSQGLPIPSAIKSDSIQVVSYLLQHFRPKCILVHGESIGGMIACHIASHFQSNIHGLICDRTFASLDSTASRLLFGTNIISHCMRYLAWWNTNVTADYLAATCRKLLIQV